MISRFRAMALLFVISTCALQAGDAAVGGRLTDPQGRPVAGAKIHISGAGIAVTDANGRFAFPAVAAGTYQIMATAAEFVDAVKSFRIAPGEALIFDLQFTELAARSDALTVTADVRNHDIQNPDPAQRVLVRDEVLDANPGRPGAPVSVPGLPSKRDPAASKRRNTSRRASRATTVSQSRNSYRWEASSYPTI